MTDQDAESVVTAAIERGWNDGAFDDLGDLYDRSFRFVTHDGDTIGFEQYTGRIDSVRSVFPDFAISPVEVIATPAAAAVQAELAGTHEGEFLGVPATERELTWQSMFRYRLADGRIREEQHFTNLLALREALTAGDGD